MLGHFKLWKRFKVEDKFEVNGMSHFGLKVNKGERPDKTPYTEHYPHSKHKNQRKWTDNWSQNLIEKRTEYYQICSIDPARKNYAIRIERRYITGEIKPILFDKVSLEQTKKGETSGATASAELYNELTRFLNKYEEFYKGCNYIIVERQLPQNYKATRIAQHTMTYFMLKLYDSELLPSIIEIDPQLKGRALGAPKNITDRQLKTWAIEYATMLLKSRGDEFSLGVMDFFKNKRDDLADTVCQIEAFLKEIGFPTTQELNLIKQLPQQQVQTKLVLTSNLNVRMNTVLSDTARKDTFGSTEDQQLKFSSVRKGIIELVKK